jgi:TRAP-type C4-dicarboxylate transport system permease large subunit
MIWLLFTANIVPGLLILVTLMIEAILSSEMSVLSGARWRNIPEDGILQVWPLIS